jgi:hypothetical protein
MTRIDGVDLNSVITKTLNSAFDSIIFFADGPGGRSTPGNNVLLALNLITFDTRQKTRLSDNEDLEDESG